MSGRRGENMRRDPIRVNDTLSNGAGERRAKAQRGRGGLGKIGKRKNGISS